MFGGPEFPVKSAEFAVFLCVVHRGSTGTYSESAAIFLFGVVTAGYRWQHVAAIFWGGGDRFAWVFIATVLFPQRGSKLFEAKRQV